jgi:hypothetical protein
MFKFLIELSTTGRVSTKELIVDQFKRVATARAFSWYFDSHVVLSIYICIILD